ncbi:MAG: hypothetical protein Q9186_003946 [Xanthomendoza sp. 1 TL-2023]
MASSSIPAAASASINPTADAAKDYYDDASTDRFYTLLWGGQDIHAGIYTSTNDITAASIATVAKMADTLLNSGITLDSKTRILDLGAGYGGAARYLAKKYKCEVVCLNLSRVQNDRNRELNRQEGLVEKIHVFEGVFEEVPADLGDGFDVVWSQDSFLHSLNREQIVSEISRLLRQDGAGRVVFTDIMASADAFEKQPELMARMMDRLHLSSLATVGFYQAVFKGRGFEDLGFWNGVEHFGTHYGRLGEELERRKEELLARGVDDKVMERQTGGMKKWVEAKEMGCVAWGIFCFGR